MHSGALPQNRASTYQPGCLVRADELTLSFRGTRRAIGVPDSPMQQMMVRYKDQVRPGGRSLLRAVACLWCCLWEGRALHLSPCIYRCLLCASSCLPVCAAWLCGRCGAVLCAVLHVVCVCVHDARKDWSPAVPSLTAPRRAAGGHASRHERRAEGGQVCPLRVTPPTFASPHRAPCAT